MLKSILVCVFLLLMACQQKADNTIYIANSEATLDSLLQNKNSSIISIAKQFLGEPYKSHSLEVGDEENLVVDLTGFDCVTYVETVLALNKANGDKNSYVNFLSELRYRNGVINGYTSRLHYFSEWIKQAEEDNLIENVSLALNGVSYSPSVNYMSDHPHLYSKLNTHELIDSIKAIEEMVSNLLLSYVPKLDVEEIEPVLKSGDIVAITTNIKGLDITHVGFIVVENSSAKFLHASSDYKKVVCSKGSVSEYLSAHKHMSGIIVLRLNEVN